jgi:hypothetical protein
MQKITFFSQINGVADAFPIDHAKNFSFKWVSRVRDDYKSAVEKAQTKFTHLARCPGIFDLLSTGYIVPMPWDLKIETHEDDPVDFAWQFPTPDIEHLMNGVPIEGHTPLKIAKYLPVKPGTLETIIKINTPWHAIVPEGVKFLIIPIPYPDEFIFESHIGILDSSISSELNFQLRWNITNGVHTIKAGTPMCQLIPLSPEPFELEVRNATQQDLEWVKKRQYLNAATFILKRPMLQRVYKKFFNLFK